jgi:DNA-binding response OmpR family regulator
MKKPISIVMIEDDSVQAFFWKMKLERHYGDRLQITIYNDPLKAVPHLGPHVDFLIIDWIMPRLDGAKMLTEAKNRDVPSDRIIIFSARSSQELHRIFKEGQCLAVIEKGDPAQEIILFQILDELIDKK